ncbi:MAG TPA: MlaD family protein [Actinomycetota bacterium]|nr:MlaD family protein [Actinomycetota bacterium]
MALPAKTKIAVNLVVFAIGAVALSLGMATQVLSVLEDRYSILATFEDAGGVFTNQEVTYRGITVGQVGRMRVVREGVEIELRINEGVQIPSEDTEARVMFKSAVGEQFVDLLPNSEGPPFFEDGDEIPLAQTSIPVSTQELLSALEGVLQGVPPEDLEGAVTALGTGLGGRGQDLALLLESTADLAELFAERRGEVEGILKSGTRLGRAFLASKEDFVAAIEQLVSVSDSLSDTRVDLKKLLEGTNLSADELIALLREQRPELHKLIVDLAEINDLQAEHTDDLAQLLGHLPQALHNVNLAFEPDTGLIRFGSIFDEHEEPESCSYGTERRPPEDRSPELPPKKAFCGDRRRPTPTLPIAAFGASARGIFSDVSSADLTDALSARPALAVSRLDDWSWALFYLNGI